MKKYRKVIWDFLICYELGQWDNGRELADDGILLESTVKSSYDGGSDSHIGTA